MCTPADAVATGRSARSGANGPYGFRLGPLYVAECQPVTSTLTSCDHDPAARSTAELEAELVALAEAGDLLARIRALTELHRREPNGLRAKALVDLRHDAYLSLAAAGFEEPGQDWPGGLGDPFGLDDPLCVDGLATVRVDDLGADTLRRGIQHHGALRVRGLLDGDRVAGLRNLVEAAWAARERVDASAAEPGDDALYSPFLPRLPYRIGPLRVWAKETGGLLGFDSPAVFLRLLDILGETGVVDAIEGYLGERPALSYDKTALRRVGVDTGSDWHQDGAFLGTDLRTVNVWIALSDCGVDAPGLDLVPARVPELLDCGTDGACFDWSIGDRVVRERAGSTGVVRPEFAAGDTLLFDQFFVHRTAVCDAMTRPRFAIESWFFAPSTYPKDRIPLWV